MKTLNHKGDENIMMTDKDFEIESIVLDLRVMIDAARREDWQYVLARCAEVEIEARKLAWPVRHNESVTPDRWANYWENIQ